MSQPGQVYNPTLTALDQQGGITFTTTTNVWVDVSRGRARAQVAASFSPQNLKRSDWIIADRAYFQTLEYDPVFKREATTCRGSEDPLLSILLACRGQDEGGVTTSLADADYHGRPAIALLTLGVLEGVGQRSLFTDTLFLDPETYLPIALEGSGRVETLDAGGVVVGSQPTGRLVRYDHAFVDSSSFADEFFSPASLGYEESDPVGAITKSTPDFTAYWLGAEAAPEGLMPITLRDAFISGSVNRPALRYRATVTYRPLVDEFGQTLLELQEWRLDEWDDFEGFMFSAWNEDPCVEKEEVREGARTATIYAAYSSALRDSASAPCPNVAPDLFVAVVHVASTVIRASAAADSPYNSEAGMREVIRSLKPADPQGT
jgi:hypothetical protein